MKTLCGALLFILLAAPAAAAQGNRSTSDRKLSDSEVAAKTKEIMAELAQSEFRARKDIPLVDCNFVENGKVMEGIFNSNMGDAKVLRTGTVTKVSSVKLMEHAIQVYFASDTLGVIAIYTHQVDTSTMSIKGLVEMARKSLAPLFDIARVDEKLEVKPKN